MIAQFTKLTHQVIINCWPHIPYISVSWAFGFVFFYCESATVRCQFSQLGVDGYGFLSLSLMLFFANLQRLGRSCIQGVYAIDSGDSFICNGTDSFVCLDYDHYWNTL